METVDSDPLFWGGEWGWGWWGVDLTELWFSKKRMEMWPISFPVSFSYIFTEYLQNIDTVLGAENSMVSSWLWGNSSA